MIRSFRAALSARHHNRKHRWGAVLVTAGILATGLTAAEWTSPQSAHAAGDDLVTAQWNMNGQRDGVGGTPESRWLTQLRQMLNEDGVDVASLQEAGSEPPPQSHQTDRRFPEPGVTEHLYNIGTESRPDIVHIYWADTGQQRNGLAIATRENVRNAVQLPVGGRFNSRPMMGVQIGETWYFNAHALSNGPTSPNDADDIIETARQFMARRHPGGSWAVLADFNRNPGRMRTNLQNHIIRTNQPTHQGGGELDFAYMNDQNNSTMNAERRGTNSDHNAYVRYHLNPNCGRQLGARSAQEQKPDEHHAAQQKQEGERAALGAEAASPPQSGTDTGTGTGTGAETGTGVADAGTPPQPGTGEAGTPLTPRDTGAAPSSPSAEDCAAPVPGETYRVFPRHLDGAVLADEDPDGTQSRPLLKKPSGSEREEVQVLYGAKPGQYLLSFKDGYCVTRYVGPSEDVTEFPCDPEIGAPPTANWKFLRGQIVTPDLNGTLQPSPNKLGATLKATTGFYQWRFEHIG
ncbi:endonuclease/exonuclease/phosphatase family protein [Streptomyces sp. 3N207]|uniref:endonuclease/exonuclease/phosphatase family protein n=1 Tax=Streptomyces sp. 3N207 TaxID=3457417 RepID=UPI003FD1724B